MKEYVLMEAATSTTQKKKYKCPYCDQRFERNKLHIHIQNKHEDLIPEGYTALRVAFNTINHKTEGHCIMCGAVTDWNESKGRYERLCNNQACHEKYKKMAADRNKNKYGTERLQNDPRYAEEVQRKALAGRRIAGKYTFTDGGVIEYLGTYEKKLLEFMDKVMMCKSEDIIAPGPAIEYDFEGAKHIYLPDFYYVPYNLLIEIKDGGSNPNKNPAMQAYKHERQEAKEAAVKATKKFNYVRLTDNNFGQLLQIMAVLKYNLQNECFDPVLMINESAILNEGYIFNDKDIYYNKDKFDSGEINLCFIIGHSGSGKSTMASKMEKEGIEKYELDDLQFAKDRFTMAQYKEYGGLIYSFFNGPGRKYYVSQADLKNIPPEEYEDKLFNDFVDYTKSYAKSHKNKKFVIEGVEILFRDSKGQPLFKPSDFKDYAFYIKGTSALVSKFRANNRDASDAENSAEYVKARIKLAFNPNSKNRIQFEKDLKVYRDYFKGLMKKEVVNETNMTGTIGAALPISPAPTPYESDPSNYYIVNSLQNNVFSYGITKDPMQSTIYSVDPTEKGFYKVFKSDKGKLDKKYLTFKIKDKQTAKQLYDELAMIESFGTLFFDDKYEPSSYIYSRLTNGSKLLTEDQILFDNRFELVRSFDEQLEYECQKLYEYFIPNPMDTLKEQVEDLERCIYG